MYALVLSERLKQEKKTPDYLNSQNLQGFLSVGFRNEVELIYQRGLDAHYYDNYFYDFATDRKRIWLLGAGYFAAVITDTSFYTHCQYLFILILAYYFLF